MPVSTSFNLILTRRASRISPRIFEISETYYRTIIDNNLFRPLGYRTPPRPIEPYRLLGEPETYA